MHRWRAGTRCRRLKSMTAVASCPGPTGGPLTAVENLVAEIFTSETFCGQLNKPMEWSATAFGGPAD